MALASTFLPKTALFPILISNPQKPKTLILCATPDRPKSSVGSGGRINSVNRVSTRTIVGVKEVKPNTSMKDINGEYNQKSKANAYDDDHEDDVVVKGAELPTD